MKKWCKRVFFCFLLAVCFWGGTLLSDRQQLNTELIRFHVIPASDSAEDQELKLQVRDAILDSIQSDLERVGDAEAALVYLQENLEKLQILANRVLEEAGSPWTAEICLTREGFDTRNTASITLPAGMYQTLKITIGDGEGSNWWCVLFPDICMDGESTAIPAGSGFQDGLRETIEGVQGYEIRFYFLELLGKLEKMLR